ncbi:hypothetical protein D1AOALGA4SA_12365 [Olavius algarvensis Delta 1 endosymbiont]|nr:hypothetical protein D1AOALGA4SA_12365 [Olavius algarvensis Delta 1 endosymbiont]
MSFAQYFNLPFDEKLTTGRIHNSMLDVQCSMFDVHFFSVIRLAEVP